MSDELAQEEEDAEDYDLEAIQMRGERAKMEAMMGIDAMAQDTREGRWERRNKQNKRETQQQMSMMVPLKAKPDEQAPTF